MYCEVVKYFLETYTTDDVVSETNADIKGFTLLLNKTSIE